MAKTKNADTCNVPNCEAKALRRGVCEAHAAENYALGCTVEGCEHEVFAKGRCRAHYMRLYRRKLGESAPAQGEAVRRYRQQLAVVYTRIPEEEAAVITRASGRADGLYEKAAEILVNWARRQRSAA